MERIVCKFGGSSLAGAQEFQRVKEILESDPRRSVVVVSAPGKSSEEPFKVTDMLLMCAQLASAGFRYDEIFEQIAERFRKLKYELKLSLDIEKLIEEINLHIGSGASAASCASRGEYLCAQLMADYLGWHFVDAADLFLFSSEGEIDEEETYRRIRNIMPSMERTVVPGFYGALPDGTLTTFRRGGSDITGSLLAAGLDAALYENWTDVPGLLMADPNIVKNVKPMRHMTYPELRELSYMGAKVLQEDAVFPLAKVGIPLQIRSTLLPEDPGTLIAENGVQSGIVTGIAVKKNFRVFTLEKAKMREDRGFLRKLLSVFESNRVTVEGTPTGIDSVSIIVSEEQLSGKLDKILEEIRMYCHPQRLTTQPGLALVVVVGKGMIRKKGVAAKIFTSLAQADINIRMISQGSSELSILVGVENEDANRAVSALYETFKGEE
ncbi:MAG: aspartate kinase [Clostridiaceae bacterium]|mgnify:CR=1 FL=1|jgi:aspartate kinase|nr:aspartate kinase [Clostridiaceae bacterium]